MPWLKRQLSLFTVVPMDHYCALGIGRGATDLEIDAAYRQVLARATASRRARALAMVFGRSPARLLLARGELLDPASRMRYDKHLEFLDAILKHPPQ